MVHILDQLNQFIGIGKTSNGLLKIDAHTIGGVSSQSQYIVNTEVMMVDQRIF